MKHGWTAAEAWGKVGAALIGGFLLFVAFSIFVSVVLPRLGVPVAHALSISTSLSVPLWMIVSVWVAVASSARRAWMVLGLSIVLMFGLTFGAYTWLR